MLSILGKFPTSRYAKVKVDSVEGLLSIANFGYCNQWAIVLILKIVLKVFVFGEYQTLLDPQVGTYFKKSVLESRQV